MFCSYNLLNKAARSNSEKSTVHASRFSTCLHSDGGGWGLFYFNYRHPVLKMIATLVWLI